MNEDQFLVFLGSERHRLERAATDPSSVDVSYRDGEARITLYYERDENG